MSTRNEHSSPDCRTIGGQLQAYVDGTLPRRESMALFLHCRECRDCRLALESTQRLFGMLGGLPTIAPPEDFDARILASVPYEAYRAMEPLRRERIPVILDEARLPAFVRSRTTQRVGALMSLVGLGGLATTLLPDWAAGGLLIGLAPAVLVQLQSLSRRIYVGMAAKTTAR